MYGEAAVVYREVNPDIKDGEWMNKCVTVLRRDWRPLVNAVRMVKNKQILLSMQPMDKVKAAFKDKDFLASTNFVPLGIWNRIINSIIEEISKNPPRVELKATDPTAVSQRREDIVLLKKKKEYEADMNDINDRIGDPHETIGAGEFKGNITEFYELGLDEADPDDIQFYKQTYQRLNFEIAGQSLINNIMRLTKFDEETTRKFVLDILSSLSISMQAYVDAITGEIKYRYIYPEEAYGIFGDSESGVDDICKGTQQAMTVREWLGAVGNEFVWDRDWQQLLWALNYCSNSKFTGFIRNANIYDVCNDAAFCAKMGCTPDASGIYQSATLDWTMAFNYKVYAGYIEFSSIDATATYLAKQGKLLPVPVPYSFNLNQPEVKEYTKESFYQEQMYKSYFLATSITSQWLYGWGKVYYQQLFGAFDQYARGTLMFYRLEGRSAAEISEPYIDFANIAFYRMKWIVFHAKPNKEQYFLPEIIKLAKGMQRLYPQMPGQTTSVPKLDTILKDIIQFKRENHVDIRDFAEIDGKPYAALQPQEGQRGGIDPIAVGLQAVTDWCEQQIAEKVGLNDMRLGQIDNPRDGFKRSTEATKMSFNSTGYIARMIQFLKNHMATTALCYAQDIVRFKDSIPYKWLQRLMGDEEFNNLKILEEFAAHRYGIFATDYNSTYERGRLFQAADVALGNQQITVSQWAFVVGTEDYKKAFKLLDFIKAKEEKKAHRRAMELIQEKNRGEMEKATLESNTKKYMADGEVKEAQIMAEASIKVAQINAGGKVDVKKLANDAEPQKQQAKADSQQQINTAKANTESQKSLI